MNTTPLADLAWKLRDLARHELMDDAAEPMWLPRSGRPNAVIGRTKLYLSNCDPEMATEVACRVQRFYDDFPHVAAGLTQVDVTDLPDGAYAGTADWHDGTFDISLNAMAYGHGKRDFLDQHMAEDYEKGFHRFTNAGASFEHELGHVLDLSMGLPGASNLDYSDALSISGYAVHGGPQEAFADAYANWREGVPNGRHADAVVSHVIRAAGRQLVAA